jgi:hypothetical protein
VKEVFETKASVVGSREAFQPRFARHYRVCEPRFHALALWLAVSVEGLSAAAVMRTTARSACCSKTAESLQLHPCPLQPFLVSRGVDFTTHCKFLYEMHQRIPFNVNSGQQRLALNDCQHSVSPSLLPPQPPQHRNALLAVAGGRHRRRRRAHGVVGARRQPALLALDDDDGDGQVVDHVVRHWGWLGVGWFGLVGLGGWVAVAAFCAGHTTDT